MYNHFTLSIFSCIVDSTCRTFFRILEWKRRFYALDVLFLSLFITSNIAQWLLLFCIVSHLLLFVHHFCFRVGRLSCFMYSFTICISGPFFSFCYGMDSGSLLKAKMGPVEVKILLSLSGWLSHGQSCHISYFFYMKYKEVLNWMFHSCRH